MDYDYYSMSYDVMRETANQIRGRYLAWANDAADAETEQYWLEQASQVTREVRQVDPYDEETITAKRAELRELQKLFETQIIPHLHDNQNPEHPASGQRPWFISVGGQPGAGRVG